MYHSSSISEVARISVVMSVYNEPLEWIEQSIDSILNQTFKDFEFIIINDNPERVDLPQFLTNYAEKDSRIRIITNPKNIGLTKSLNIGLNNSRGEYIARMDADDISLPTRFEKQIEFMDAHPEVIVCGTKIKLFGKIKPFYIKNIFTNDIDIRGQMFYNSGFAHPTVFIRKATLDKAGIKYDETFRNAQDYKLWYDLRYQGKYANLKEKLVKYRLSEQQVTQKSYSTQQDNRNLISNLFYHERNLSDKKLEAYYYRSEAYKRKKPLELIIVSLSGKTSITIKERISLIIKGMFLLFTPNTNK